MPHKTSLPTRWQTTFDRMASLQVGWNGYAAEPPTAASLSLASSFLASLPEHLSPDRVAPSAVGGVGVTFRAIVRATFVYVEFLNAGPVLALFADGRNEPESKRVGATAEGFKSLVDDIKEYLRCL